ncbi:hypothetical protein [Rosistilla oblonga]|uniref:hypothetical protein n=1 Tax=Rosistilla oblonga TaxID=2527990 RepID=UPI003A9722E7
MKCIGRAIDSGVLVDVWGTVGIDVIRIGPLSSVQRFLEAVVVKVEVVITLSSKRDINAIPSIKGVVPLIAIKDVVAVLPA